SLLRSPERMVCDIMTGNILAAVGRMLDAGEIMAVCPLSGGEWYCPDGKSFYGTTYCHLQRCISVRSRQMGDYSDLVMRSIFLPTGLDAKLRQLAHETNRTRSDLIQEFVAAGMAKWESEHGTSGED